MRSSGTCLDRLTRGVQRGFKGVEVAVVDADQGAFQRAARSSSAALMHFDQGIHAPLKCWPCLKLERPVRHDTEAMMIRIQSAPRARASAT